MPSLRTVLALAVVLVGLSVFGVGIDAAATAAQPTYDHSVAQADADTDRIQAVANDSSVRAVYDFPNLSAAAQDAFLAALAAPDGEASVRGARDRPPEFAYGDGGALGEGEYYVRYEGDYYVLRTQGSQFSGWLGAVPVLLATVLVGGSAIVSGALGYFGYDPRLAASAFVGTTVPASLVVSDTLPSLPLPGLGGFDGLVVVGVLAGGAAWYALGWLWRQ